MHYCLTRLSFFVRHTTFSFTNEKKKSSPLAEYRSSHFVLAADTVRTVFPVSAQYRISPYCTMGHSGIGLTLFFSVTAASFQRQGLQLPVNWWTAQMCETKEESFHFDIDNT